MGDKNVIILLENEAPIIQAFQNQFADLELQCDLRVCKGFQEYDEALKNAKANYSLRGIVMDLSNTAEEEDSKKYKAAEYIQEEYDFNRIPIFVHSGNLEHYQSLLDKGTVYRIAKGKESIPTICNSIKKMEDSGFLNIFCLGGELEKKIMSEIHNAFVNQFKSGEIENIIESINSGEPKDPKLRTREVFERIAIRSVFENWKSARRDETDSIKEVLLNSIEHYYRRLSDFEFWTGDIFKMRSDTNVKCIIITPRCNVGHQNFDELLLCKIQDIKGENLKVLTGKKGQERLKKNITDHEIVGERYRFLPPTPTFSGGLVDFKTVFSLKIENFKKLYEIDITLSDELTNDVIRKFAAYSLRGGISETELKEAHYYVTQLLKESD